MYRFAGWKEPPLARSPMFDRLTMASFVESPLVCPKDLLCQEY